MDVNVRKNFSHACARWPKPPCEIFPHTDIHSYKSSSLKAYLGGKIVSLLLSFAIFLIFKAGSTFSLLRNLLNLTAI